MSGIRSAGSSPSMSMVNQSTTKETRSPMNFTRQLGIANPQLLAQRGITLIGAGSLGSVACLCLTKMGCTWVEVYDEDGVTEHNIPNQFYKLSDVRQFKVDALDNIVREFCGVELTTHLCNYVDQPIRETVIVATDNMASRRLVWDRFKKQVNALNYVEMRMGGELGRIYCIRKWKYEGNPLPVLQPEDIKFYEDTLYSDKEAIELPCTARAVMYNSLLIGSIIGKIISLVSMDHRPPREIIVDLEHFGETSWMVRK